MRISGKKPSPLVITVSAEKGAQDQRDGGGGEQEEASLQPPAREADQHCPD